MKGIFIAYRQEDSKPWALLLRKDLEEAFGEENVFLDKDTLRAGNWRTQIHEALSQCRVIVVVIGRQWLSITDGAGLRRLDSPDDVHRNEIAFALSREEVTVIPVRVDGAAMPQAGDLPSDIRLLADQQSRELSDGSVRRKVDIQILIEDIQRVTGLKDNRKVKLPINDGGLMQRVKALFGSIVAISILLLVVWVFFYIFQPDAPLTNAESIIVAGICAVIVVSAKFAWVRIKKRREANDLTP